MPEKLYYFKVDKGQFQGPSVFLVAKNRKEAFDALKETCDRNSWPFMMFSLARETPKGEALIL